MRRGCRTGNETFNPAQTRCADGQSGAFDKTIGICGIALDFKAEHSAETVQQFSSMDMSGTGFQSRVIHLFDNRVMCQKFSDRQCTFILIFHSNSQSFHTPVQEKTGVGIQGTAQMDELMGNFVNQIFTPDHGAGDNIRMTVKILGAAMQRQIESPFRRSKVDGAGKGVVDHQNDAAFLGKTRNACHIRHPQRRV